MSSHFKKNWKIRYVCYLTFFFFLNNLLSIIQKFGGYHRLIKYMKTVIYGYMVFLILISLELYWMY